MKIQFKRKELCDVIFKSQYKALESKFRDLDTFLMKKTLCGEKNKSFLMTMLSSFKFQFKSKWHKCNRNKERFFVNEKSWLEGVCKFNKFKPLPGRPMPIFESTSTSTKRRRTKTIRTENTAEELLFAAQVNFRKSGEKQTATRVQEIIDSSNDTIQSDQVNATKLSSASALSMLVEAKLSKHQYQVIRNYFKDLLPSYGQILKEKEKSYPSDIKVTESEASAPLQSILDHTVQRLITTISTNELPLTPNDNNVVNATLISKWGFDGSSGHSQYMQKYVDNNDDDKFVFLSCLVPIELNLEQGQNNVVLWQNPTPSSTRLCRPIHLTFKQESEALIKIEKDRIEAQIARLVDTKLNINDKEVLVKHKLLLTMVDGKICNTLTETKSAMRCYLCQSTSKDFNKLNLVTSKPLLLEHITFGISILHSWIRLFENLLHIAYRLPIKQWRINKQCEKIVNDRKTYIQKEFRQRLGLIVDRPKPGYGNTNDGNLARRFFQNADVSSDIMGIDKNLIHRFHIILQVMSSGSKIDSEKFKDYCLDTAKLYV